jgi:predicted permease
MTLLSRPLQWLDDARRDLRHAARLLFRSPVVTLTAVSSLAIGIGATTTAFTLANALLFQPPRGVSEPAHLVDIGATRSGGGFGPSSYRDYLDISQRASTLERVYAYSRFPLTVSVREAGRPDSADASLVTAGYFTALGARAAVGRLFGPEESDGPGESPVVVLGHGFWTRRFAQDPAVVGRTLSVNGQAFTVIGVAADGFSGTGVRALDLWIPIGMAPAISADGAKTLTDRSARGLMIGARGRPEASMARIAADIDLVGKTLEGRSEAPDARTGLRALPAAPIPGRAGPLVALLALLAALVACVLIVACANVAGILLARGAARRREMGVRLAIGSGRARLVRQLLAEALLLFAIGGGAGWLLAAGVIATLASQLPALPFPVSLSLRLDARAAAVTSAIALIAAVLSGLAPAIDAARADVLAALRGQSPIARRLRLRHALVGAQVAFSMILVIGAGLFTRALVRAATIDPGFDPRGVELASIDLAQGGLTERTGPPFVRELLERVRRLPAVQEASIGSTPPGGVEVWREALSVASRPQELVSVDWNVIESGYFATLRIPIVAGHDFTDADRAGTQPAVIVSESAARRFWPREDALGQYLAQPGGPAGPPRMLLVVGVARDVESSTLIDGLGRSGVYVPLQQQYVPRVTIAARTRHGERITEDLRVLLASMHPSLPVTTARSLDDAIALGLAPQRVAASAAGALGLVGLLLTGIGVYGVMAYAVARRTREIGLRIALGARRSNVIGMVLREGLWLAALGSAAGAGVAMLASRVLAGFLFGISPADPVTLLGTSVLFLLCGLAACGVPVLRATRIQPTQALRDE